MRSGHTLSELLVVVALAGALTAIAAPRMRAARDQALVRDAATEIVAALDAARAAAQRLGTLSIARFDTLAGTVRVIVERDTVLVLPFGAELGVSFEASRDSVTYGPSGRGYGAANTSLIVRRGEAVDTVFVSRLGRVRRTR
jgi:type IV fimbrial biogenesis protein FimT